MLRLIFRLARPLHWLFAGLTFLLGVGIARYLGEPLDLTSLFLGLTWVLLLLISFTLLAGYYRPVAQHYQERETPRQRRNVRALLLQVSAALLTLAAGFTVVLLRLGSIHLLTGFLMMLIFILLTAYSVPPFSLANAGFGDIILALYLGSFVPIFGFLLQTNNFHRLVAITTFPLVLLALTYLLITGFPTFASDQKFARHTFLTRLSWQYAIPLHHILLLTAYAIFALAPLFDYPWALFGPAMLTLPLGILQIIWLRRITLGGRPIWRFLVTNAAAVFGLTVYVLALTFWIR